MALRGRFVGQASDGEKSDRSDTRRAQRSQDLPEWKAQPIAPREAAREETPKQVPTATAGTAGSALRELPLNAIEPNKDQPRSGIKNEDLAGLAQSIKTYGLIHPIIVRPHGDRYQIIAGERRWRASRIAGLKLVPVRVMPRSDYETLELALVENLQRTNLNPIEEAYGYLRLTSSYDLTPGDLAARLGKSRSTLVNIMRLTELAEDIQLLVFQDKLKAGHARALLGLPPEFRLELAQFAIKEQLSVRDVEDTVRGFDGKKLDLRVKTFLPGLEVVPEGLVANTTDDVGASGEESDTALDAAGVDADAETAATVSTDAVTGVTTGEISDESGSAGAVGAMDTAGDAAAKGAPSNAKPEVTPRIPRRKKTQAETAMVRRLGTNVQIKRSSHQNRIVIDFTDADDLARVVQLVCQL
ncbi:MAG: ParB/RepB/Spo0J family partition protein [Coriobacteriia bacterium]|nr:ParB/RepB/Spo0J family partition protein [Coriobacteriia bacterium]